MLAHLDRRPVNYRVGLFVWVPGRSIDMIRQLTRWFVISGSKPQRPPIIV